MTTQTSPLDPSEEAVFTLDATPGLDPGETLTGILQISVTLLRGSDPNAAQFVLTNPAPAINTAPVTVNKLIGSPLTIATGCCVQGAMASPVDGVWYQIKVVCSTTNPLKRLALKAVVPGSAA